MVIVGWSVAILVNVLKSKSDRISSQYQRSGGNIPRKFLTKTFGGEMPVKSNITRLLNGISY